MKLNYTFKQIEKSQSVIDYVEEKLQKLNKFEYRPQVANVVFKVQRHNHVTEIVLTGNDGKIQTIASADSFTASIDTAIQKLQRQLSRIHTKFANKKKPQQSKMGRLARLRPNMEYDYQWQPGRRSGKAA